MQTAAPPDGDSLLLVEDDTVLRELYGEALGLAGFTVVPAADGATALQALQRQDIAAVLLDGQLPDMDGLAVLRAIRGRPSTRTLPVLLVTGEAGVAERIRGLEAGASDYVVKPVELGELIARVRAQLRGQAAWMRLLDAQLRERATVAEALCRLSPGRTPELTADLICAEVFRLRGLDGTALLAFTDDGNAVPLARQGRVSRAMRIGLPLPAALAIRLRARAEQGAWVEHRATQPPGSDGPPLLGPDALVAAYAPLHSRGRLLGLLALSTGAVADDAPSDESAQALSAAIDFAAVATALLGPGLQQRFAVRTSRARVEQMTAAGAFTPVFQRVVDLASGETVGYEALTRFADRSDPQRQFAEAARVGAGEALERTTMAAALRAAGDRLGDAWLSVNVSPGFLSGGGAEAESRQAACPLVLELTEHDPIEDYGEISRAVQRLGREVRLSIDDAGAGYACLTHVLTLEPEFVKLDRGWVMGIDRDPARQALVAGLQSFARRTGATLIAEGIETEAELGVLRSLDVPLGQGFLLGRPAPVENLAGISR